MGFRSVSTEHGNLFLVLNSPEKAGGTITVRCHWHDGSFQQIGIVGPGRLSALAASPLGLSRPLARIALATRYSFFRMIRTSDQRAAFDMLEAQFVA